MNRKSLLLFALMALFAPLAVMGQEFDHLTYFTQTSTDDFKHGTPYLVDIADGSVSLQYRMSSVAEWVSTTNMPQTLKQHQVVTWRDWVYLVGGSSDGTNAVSTVYRATKQTNGISGWTGLNNMPVTRKDMAVVATQTRLFVIGGRNSSGTMYDKIYSAPFNSDGSIGSWTASEVTLPHPACGMRAVLAMGNIYLLGGTAIIDSVETVTNNTYLLKVNADGDIASIAEATSLPEARSGHAVAFYDSKIFVTGGCDATATPKNTVWSAIVGTSGVLGEWTERTEMPKALYDHTAVFANGVLAVLGGNDGTMVNDEFYYTTLDATALTWTLSDIYMPARYTQGASFAFGDKIFFCGGEALSGAINSNVAYMPVTTTNKPIRKTAFVSEPIYVGSAKTMQQLDYTINLGTGTSCEILFRTAGTNKVFGSWTSRSSNNPATINQSKNYIQYMFRFSATSSCTQNLSLDDVSLVISGYSQLTGNLNDIPTLTLAGSPYWVTQDVSFTSGTHDIEAGVTIMFQPNTGMTIGQASVNFNGTQASPILLTAYEAAAGSWNGVYFQDASDNGVSSVMNYTTIEKAGNGGNDANLYLYYTNQPTMSHCTFKLAQGRGAVFQNSSPTITNCTFTENTGRGLMLYNSSPSCTSCTMSNNNVGLGLDNSAPTCNSCTMMGNSYAGIYFHTANFNATFTSVTSKNNLYGIYSCTPDHSFTFGTSNISLSNNTNAGIGIAGGRIASDQTWNKYTGGYALLGNVEIYGGTPKLTIQAGTTIKGNTGCGLYVGAGGSQGGMLYAVGTTSQLITFTSLNGEVGGWDGVRFRDGSDYSSTSSMRRCVVEKGTTNLVCENTNQPTAKWCTFQDARDQNVYLNNASISLEGSTLKNAPKGLWVNSSAPSLVSVVFENHSEVCVYHNNECNPTYSDCTMKDSHIGIRYWTCNRDFTDVDNVSFENNYCNIGMPGGDINASRTWETNSYAILGSIRVGGYNAIRRLTIDPGATLRFAESTNLSFSWYGSDYYGYHYYGELNAVGTEESPIVFTSMNGESGGWNGIVFDDRSDNMTGQESILQHCIIENGNEYNLHLSYTNQPSVIENCLLQNSNGYGLYFYDCGNGVTVSDCQFQNNGNYGLYFNNAYYVHDFANLTFTGNLHDGIAMGGGDITVNRTWNTYDYYILGSVRVGGYNAIRRLTIDPGATLRFAESTNLSFSWYGSDYYGYHYYGELNAVGTEESPIVFTSMNGESGGWNGIVFDDRSDNMTGQESILQHCIIENGNEYNLHLSYTNQPSVIENCLLQNSNGYGLYFYYASPTVGKCVIKNNASHGIYLNNNAHPIVGGSAENANSIYGNGGYQAYQDGGQNVNMTYNFWGQPSYRLVEDEFVYDKLDNPDKGRITVNPTCWFPMENFNRVRGYFTYNESQIMAGKRVKIINANGTQQAAVNTNSNGRFTFNNYHVNVYNTINTDFGIDILAGVNATDALLVMRHFVHLDTLTGGQLFAADVNLSGNINGTDAMLIMRRAIDEEFPSGDYYYYSPSGMSITENNVEYDLSFLCYGDVNGSYTLPSRDNGIELLHEGQLLAGSYQEMELPVSIKQAVEMGALTLRFGYPEEYVEIEDVVLAATGESLLFTANEGELTTVWFSLQPLALAENDGLIIIKVRTKDLSNINEPVAFSLSAYSELADGNAQVLDGVAIAMPDIVTETLGVSENTTNGNVALAMYPNPAKDVCTMAYQLPEAGRVTVSVYNTMGVKVMDVADFRQEEGRHELRLSTASLAAGMYTCRITFEGESSWVKTTKLTIEK